MFRAFELLKITKGKLIGRAKNISIKGVSIDSRTLNKGEAFIAIKGSNFDGHNFIREALEKGAKAVIVSAGKPWALAKAGKAVFIEVKDTARALGDIARAHRNKFDIPVIALSGSCGKTTTKEMIAWVLSKKFRVLKNEGTQNNHIGLPLTLLKLNQRHEVAVLEIGTNHPGEVEYLAKICLANIAVITNIGPSHLEYFRTLRAVSKEKLKLIDYLRHPSVAVLNADDYFLSRRLKGKVKRNVFFSFGISHRADFSAREMNYKEGGIEFLLNKKNKFCIRTLGFHNIYNVLAACVVARILGMGYKDISKQFAAFDFPPSRLKVRKLKNATCIDDTYNSNPLSLKGALEALHNFSTEGRKICVMGDMLELGDNRELFHREAGEEIIRVCDALITVGDLSKLAASAAKTLKGDEIKDVFICNSITEAREILFNKILLRKEDVVLVKGSRAMKMEEVFRA